MRRGPIALLGGLMFGAGLGLSGIANPVVINNFLDLASPDLDFTLLILFCVALLASTVAYQLILRSRDKPVFVSAFKLPTRTDIDGRLVVGAAIFGLGWSLSGLCGGPALASLSALFEIALPYLAALALGSVVCGFVLGERHAN